MKFHARAASAGLALALCASSASAQYGVTTRVSEAPNPAQSDGDSDWPAASLDGRWIAFSSKATNLLGIGLDTNGKSDVFLLDRSTGALARVSVGLGGSELANAAFHPSLSDDGRYVSFDSIASTVVAGDTNNAQDVFVFDRVLGTATRASVSSSGGQANSMSQLAELSADGRWVAFESGATNLDVGDTNTWLDIYWRDTVGGSTKLVSRALGGLAGNDCSGGDAKDGPSISADGRWVAFQSTATDLVANDTNKSTGLACWWGDAGVDVFVWDALGGTCVRVSESASGVQSIGGSYQPVLSGDGRYVAFTSSAGNLVLGDTNGASDVFVRDRDSDGNGIFDEPGGVAMTRASLSTAGTQGNVGSGTTALGWSGPDLSRSGTRVVFHSHSSNLDPLDTNQSADVYVRDLAAQELTLVSVDLAGATSGVSHSPAMSGDGSLVAFVSTGGNLVLGDGNALADVFARRLVEPPFAYCTAKVNSLGCTPDLTTAGFASASYAASFDVTCTQVGNKKFGMVVYSLVGAMQAPFQGGFLCVAPPLERTPLVPTGGSPTGSDCTGAIVFDFNAYAQSGVNPALIDGQSVWIQAWCRDSGDPFGTSLSAARGFVLAAL